jgi:hypothetical protein
VIVKYIEYGDEYYKDAMILMTKIIVGIDEDE